MPRGSKPGERRGGRKAGTPNKHTAEIRTIAQAFGPDAIAALAEMAGLAPGTRAESETARIAALKELLDRGYGKATQPLSGDAEAAPVTVHYKFEWADAVPPEPEPDEDAVEDAATGILVTFGTETC